MWFGNGVSEAADGKADKHTTRTETVNVDVITVDRQAEMATHSGRGADDTYARREPLSALGRETRHNGHITSETRPRRSLVKLNTCDGLRAATIRLCEPSRRNRWVVCVCVCVCVCR